MKKYALLVFLTFLLGFILTVSPYGTIFGENQKEEEGLKDYNRIRAQFGKLYQQQKYSEAVALLEKNFNRFPEKIHANCWNIAVACVQLKNYKKAIRYLKKALDSGYWFNIWAFEGEFFKPLKKYKSFIKVLNMNNRLRDETQKTAKPELEVSFPADYNPDKKYPLFIALHGGGENIQEFKPHWTSDKLKKEFIVAYVQSSQVVSMTGFAWENLEISKKEITDAYNQLLNKFPVKTDEVMIGGFSSGGVASLVMVLDNVIPVTGFIVLCPAKPRSFSEDLVIKARDRGLRGTLITTQMDNRIQDQRLMVDCFKNTGFQYQFVVFPNMGHWYPEELNQMIDQAIDHIRNQ